MSPVATDSFLDLYNGECFGILRWEQLDALWERVRASAERGWYVYAVGDPVPDEPVEPDALERFLQELDGLLRREHESDYCGIVYTDSRESPSLIKIYDPNNLGMVCGSSEYAPLPGWVLSRPRPVDLPSTFPPPANRRRWWRRIFG
jgi:hypothetical protein